VNSPTPFRLEHQPAQISGESPHANVLVASEDYFKAVGQTLLRGRTFLASDNSRTSPSIILNQYVASRYWKGEDPVGKRLTFDNGATWATIVGVVADTREQIDAEPVEEIYAPLRVTSGMTAATVVVRTSAAPATLTHDLREAIRRVDPQQPVTSIETIEQVRDNSLAPRKLTATLLGLFALLALAITAAGIGGVLAFSVSQRTNEIGIRMALGASRGAVLWMVLRQGLLLVAIGLAVGTAAALALGHLATSVLYGVEPSDPATLVGVILVLLGVAATACLLPARRATAINPLVALREN
jgi:predicted permease